MSPGNTNTGHVLEAMIVPSLRRGGYAVEDQVPIESRLGGGTQRVDALAIKDDRRYLVSLKWQQVSGTAEQKVPFEVLCLTSAVQRGHYAGAYLVLGGEGWSLREFFTSGGLRPFLTDPDSVRIVTLEGFVALANSGRL